MFIYGMNLRKGRFRPWPAVLSQPCDFAGETHLGASEVVDHREVVERNAPTLRERIFAVPLPLPPLLPPFIQPPLRRRRPVPRRLSSACVVGCWVSVSVFLLFFY